MAQTVFESGIDVSRYQGNIDWQKVKAAGKQFAIIRCVSSNNSGPYIDPTFRQNIEGARAAGLKVGAYYYTYATTEDQAIRELTLVLEALQGQKLEYPVFVDMEDSSIAALGKAQATALARFALTVLDQKKWYAGLYTYTNFANTYLNMNELSGWPLFIADYRGFVGYKGPYAMWQYSSTGSVNGISGNVDLDYSYENFLPAILAGGYNGFTGPVMVPLQNTLLEVFGTANTEYFNSPDVYDIAGSLENGFYPAVAKSNGEYNGFTWVQFKLGDQVYWTALLPDRTRLVTQQSDCCAEAERLRVQLDETNAKLDAANAKADEAAAALRRIADWLENG